MTAVSRAPEALDSLGDIRGVRVGRSESPDGRSGVTAVLFGAARPTVIDVRGGASCTYDTASLALDATFGRRWALFFAGGSVFGLDAARGIRTRIIEEGGGHTAFRNPNPVAPISGATLFDLPVRAGRLPDYLPIGYLAATEARRGPFTSGRRGAGTGATVGKYLGRDRAMPGGEGTASEPVRGLGRVGVIAAVNAIGAVRDPTDGRWKAGARDRTGGIVPPETGPALRAGPGPERGTTLVVGVIELTVDRRVLQRLAGQIHVALARAIHPVHSSLDGDVVFAVSVERRPAPGRERRPGAVMDALGSALGRCTERAIVRAVSAGDDASSARRSRGGAAARPGGHG
jgi:L-aminopeptidase/D-esterase-like protein